MAARRAQRDLAGAGVQLMRQYADAGLDTMLEKGTFEDGGMSVEAGVQEMRDRMRVGRWKVDSSINEIFSAGEVRGDQLLI
jgi:hypothetical protein